MKNAQRGEVITGFILLGFWVASVIGAAVAVSIYVPDVPVDIYAVGDNTANVCHEGD